MKNKKRKNFLNQRNYQLYSKKLIAKKNSIQKFLIKFTYQQIKKKLFFFLKRVQIQKSQIILQFQKTKFSQKKISNFTNHFQKK